MYLQGHNLGSFVRAIKGQRTALEYHRLHYVLEDIDAIDERGINLLTNRELQEPKDVWKFHQFVVELEGPQFEEFIGGRSEGKRAGSLQVQRHEGLDDAK